MRPIDQAFAFARPGERFWYWYTGRIGASPKLVFTPVEEDPEAEVHRARVVASTGGVLEREWQGVAQVDPVGRIRFFGREPRGFVHDLARWVDREGARVPGLLRLVGAHYVGQEGDLMLRTEQRGAVAWADLVPEELSEDELVCAMGAASVLRAAAPGDGLGFWFGVETDGRATLLLALPDEVEELRDRVVSVRTKCSSELRYVSGTLELGREDVPNLRADDGPDLLPELVDWVSRCIGFAPDLERLVGVRREGRGEDVGGWASVASPVPVADLEMLTGLEEVLPRLTHGERWRFVVGCANERVVRLWIGRADEEAGTSVSDGMEVVRGQVGSTRSGRLRFQSLHAAPWFLSRLATFVHTNRAWAPALVRLANASFRVVRDGAVIDEQRDETLWNPPTR